MDKLAESLRKNEGRRNQVYLDSEGKLTGGIGHHFWVGSKIPDEAIEAFFKQDIADAVSEFMKLPANYRKKLDPARRRVIVEMIFNMNLPKVLGFKKFWAAVEVEDWNTATMELIDSKWARQVKSRAIKLAELFRLGGD